MEYDSIFILKLEIKSSAYSEALQYQQDHLPITTREHTSLTKTWTEK